MIFSAAEVEAGKDAILKSMDVTSLVTNSDASKCPATYSIVNKDETFSAGEEGEAAAAASGQLAEEEEEDGGCGRCCGKSVPLAHNE